MLKQEAVMIDVEKAKGLMLPALFSGRLHQHGVITYIFKVQEDTCAHSFNVQAQPFSLL